MSKRLAMCGILLAVGAVSLPSRAQPSATTRPAGTEPATAEKVPDYCTGLIDPYNPVTEKHRFLLAAGRDGVLTGQEFDAVHGKPNSFARAFEHRADLRAFDRNKDAKIDWFEADAYRRDLAKRVLDNFDADNDGHLRGPERDKANAALHNRAMLLSRGATTQPTTRPTTQQAGSKPIRADRMLAKYDLNGDGLLDAEEFQAAQQLMAKEHRERILQRYDADGDGELSREEWQAYHKERMDPMQARLEKLKLVHFDADNDGELSEDEQADLKRIEKIFKDLGKQTEVLVWDLDGDGKVTGEERQKVQQEFNAVGWRYMARLAHWADLDRDGQLTWQEREKFQDQAREAMFKWFNRQCMSYDMDGDGRLLTEKEREAFTKGFPESVLARIRKHDADRSGRVDPMEFLGFLESAGKELGLAPPAKDSTTTQPAGD